MQPSQTTNTNPASRTHSKQRQHPSKTIYLAVSIGELLPPATPGAGLIPIEQSHRISPLAESREDLDALERVMRACPSALKGARIFRCKLNQFQRRGAHIPSHAIFVPVVTPALEVMRENHRDRPMDSWEQLWIATHATEAAHV